MIGSLERRIRKIEQVKKVEEERRFLLLFDVGADGSSPAEAAFDALEQQYGAEAISAVLDDAATPYRPRNPRVFDADQGFVDALARILEGVPGDGEADA